VTGSMIAEAAALTARGEQFVLATVVWRRAPSSGQVGSKAIVLPDGSMRGWLGGACATPAVRREATSALADGRSRLLLLGVPEEVATALGDGVEVIPMACGSEGALAVYLEPVVPAPLVVAVGDSPAVSTLAGLVREVGWRAAVAPGADDIDANAIDGRAAVVVATQGHDDEAALQAALRTPAGYIGLIASRQRAEVTFGYLRDRGVAEADLARVQAPAGLDLGSTDHREIAVAVLAELVARRARGELRPAPIAAPAADTAVDPVCGMSVEIATARWTLERDGQTWYFCNPGCLETFKSSVSHDHVGLAGHDPGKPT
jgi:xanthine dehydrogenase accessory factor